MFRIFFVIVILFITVYSASSQNIKSFNKDKGRISQDTVKTGRISQDSTKTKQDSLRYLKIEKLSKKSIFTKYLHNLFFRSLIPNAKKKIEKPQPSPRAEGKIIRKINIVTLDPFGYSLIDTLKHPQGIFQQTANGLHLKTQSGIIKNLLLFRRNQPYDSLKVNESMRLIRSQQYIQDVSLFTRPTAKRSDSIDVYIRVLDVWSIIPSIDYSPTTLGIELMDNNFAGLGNQFYGQAMHNSSLKQSLDRIGYYIPNIRHTYLSAAFQYVFSPYNDLLKTGEFANPYFSSLTSNIPYQFSQNRGITKSVDLERPFYSPLAKWAGGFFLGQIITAQGYIPQDSVKYLNSLTNIQDLWGAKSWRLFREFPTDYITSLILSGRILRIRYHNPPAAGIASGLFQKEDLYFTGVGITSRKYVQDKYIFNYGKIEDVPVGRSLALTFGYDIRQNNRFYAGIRAAWGHYYPTGYLSADLEYGTFIRKTGFEQGVFSARVNYFTKLMTLGRWKIRQFISPTFVLGLNRLPTENVTLSDEIKGFEGAMFSAKHIAVLSLQTQTYAPWNFYGFHFGPYVFSSLALMGDQTSTFLHTPVYSLIGIGILIKNDYLMFNNFQLSLSLYPLIPGHPNNILKFNAYSASDYGFTNFEIPKPSIANYR